MNSPSPHSGDGDGHSALGERRRLVSIAYRLLGSLADAEDVVQETYARWFALSLEERAVISSPGAWLNTVASRLSLNVLRSARVRRESYVGAWIPEPVPAHVSEWITSAAAQTSVDPADRVSVDESVSMAFLVVLDSLTPAERVSFVLHDVFGFPFPEVAEIVGRSPAACRQLASSGRRRLRGARRPSPPLASRAAIVGRFRQAWEAKDIEGLVVLLDPDAVATADGGVLAVTFTEPIHGARQIAQAWATLADRLTPTTRLSQCIVNGEAGLMVDADGTTTTVIAFGIAADRICDIWVIRNPEKLRHWTGQ